MHLLAKWLVALLAVASMPAQVLVVDASGAPGSSFTSIATAVASVPSGAVLEVRAGVYAPFAIQNKAIAIFGEAGVVVTANPFATTAITVTGTAPDQPVVLRGIRLRSSFGGALSVMCDACDGPLSLQGLFFDEGPYSGIAAQLLLRDCRQASIDQCGPFRANGMAAAVTVERSDAVMIGVQTQPNLGIGLQADDSDVQLLDCSIMALSGAIALNASSLRIAGASLVEGMFFSPSVAMQGVGSVQLSPSTTVVGSIEVGVNAVTSPVAFVVASPAVIGGTADASLTGPVGHLGALFLGEHAAPMLVPGFAAKTWMLPVGYGAEAIGVFGSDLTASVAVPNAPSLAGRTLVWQGVTFDPATGLVLSMPAFLTVLP